MVANYTVEIDAFRTGKAYTISEAAKLAHTSYQNARRWLVGYEVPGHRMKPVFGDRPLQQTAPQPLMVSFIELIEIVMAARFRAGTDGQPPVPLERVRNAHQYARERLKVPYPFASLDLKTSGGHILHEFDEAYPGPRLIAISARGQITLPGLVQNEICNLDYDATQLADKWHPLGRIVPIVINPMVGAGRPTIEGTGVTVRTIEERFRAGDTVAYLAEDYDIAPEAIEYALHFAAA